MILSENERKAMEYANEIINYFPVLSNQIGGCRFGEEERDTLVTLLKIIERLDKQLEDREHTVKLNGFPKSDKLMEAMAINPLIEDPINTFNKQMVEEIRKMTDTQELVKAIVEGTYKLESDPLRMQYRVVDKRGNKIMLPPETYHNLVNYLERM